MPHISVPSGVPGMRSLLQARPETAGPITALAQTLLYAPNSLSRGDRELIAAYVSALNDCTFCCTSHAAIAACHLQDQSLVDEVLRSPDAAPVTPKLRALHPDWTISDRSIAAEVRYMDQELSGAKKRPVPAPD